MIIAAKDNLRRVRPWWYQVPWVRILWLTSPLRTIRRP